MCCCLARRKQRKQRRQTYCCYQIHSVPLTPFDSLQWVRVDEKIPPGDSRRPRDADAVHHATGVASACLRLTPSANLTQVTTTSTIFIVALRFWLDHTVGQFPSLARNSSNSLGWGNLLLCFMLSNRGQLSLASLWRKSLLE